MSSALHAFCWNMLRSAACVAQWWMLAAAHVSSAEAWHSSLTGLAERSCDVRIELECVSAGGPGCAGLLQHTFQAGDATHC